MRISDWSSDVCSSDLFQEFLESTFIPALRHLILERGDVDLAYDCLISKLWIESTRSSASNDEVLERHAATIQRNLHRFRPIAEFRNVSHDADARDEAEVLEIGRAACRERVWQAV